MNSVLLARPSQGQSQLTLGQHLQTGNTSFTPCIPFPVVFALDTPPSSRVHSGHLAVVAPDSSLLGRDILERFELGDLMRLCLRQLVRRSQFEG